MAIFTNSRYYQWIYRKECTFIKCSDIFLCLFLNFSFIVSNNNGLDLINQLEVKNFEYKTEDEIKTDNPELTDVAKAAVVDKTGIQLGMIAQEVEAILPNCVKTTNGIKSLNTTEMFFYMVNAIKELSAEVEALKTA